MKVYKYGTGDDIPEGAIYLTSVKNGNMNGYAKEYQYVWHYFLVTTNTKKKDTYLDKQSSLEEIKEILEKEAKPKFGDPIWERKLWLMYNSNN